MLELHLAGIHDDGEHLVLESAEGSQFSLQIDQELRASISRARKIQPARERLKMSDFGPRDIQSRFRQGATVEEIVAESGWDADRVRRYEWPIVAERANIINVARSLLISQSHTGRSSDASALPLEEHIIRVAKKYKFSQAQPDWNTFQQESGQWTISLDFDLTEQMKAAIPRGIVFPARWSYNPANQSIYASNEAAYFLMGRDHSTDAPLPGIGANEPTPTERLPLVSEAAEKTHTPTIKAVQPNKTTAQDRLLEELASRRGGIKKSALPVSVNWQICWNELDAVPSRLVWVLPPNPWKPVQFQPLQQQEASSRSRGKTPCPASKASKRLARAKNLNARPKKLNALLFPVGMTLFLVISGNNCYPSQGLPLSSGQMPT